MRRRQGVLSRTIKMAFKEKLSTKEEDGSLNGMLHRHVGVYLKQLMLLFPGLESQRRLVVRSCSGISPKENSSVI